MWEEPCISGTLGSGTVFFGGCNLRCRFCQNYQISRSGEGVLLDENQLANLLLRVANSGVHNVNLVTPQHYSDVIARALAKVKHKLPVPVVYNTNSYESVGALANLEGLVDVYLPDFKFVDSTLSNNLCGASNYFEVASAALAEMLRQQPVNVFDDDGIIQRGVIVRHLVIPSQVEDSKRVLDFLASVDKDVTVSVMSQFFVAQQDDKYPFLNRKLTNREYQNVVDYFFNVGLTNGYMQDPSSATQDYLPTFDVNDVLAYLKGID
jgi:putative pyruvate formate lyase activating enzyme